MTTHRRPRAFVRARAHPGRPRPTAELATDADTLELLLYGSVGWEIWVDDIVTQLAQSRATRIRVFLNSPGGDAFDGIALYNALSRHPAQVRVEVDGLAASAASVIAMAGDEIVMGTGATMMIHDASVWTYGPAAELRQAADVLDTISDSIASIYASRAGGEPAVWRDAMTAETWLTADEAVQAGLATSTAVLERAPVSEPDDGNGGGAQDGNGGGGDHEADMASALRAAWTWDGRDHAPPPTRLLHALTTRKPDPEPEQLIADLRAALATMRRQ